MHSDDNTKETPRFHTIKIQRSDIFPESQHADPDSATGDVKRLDGERPRPRPERETPCPEPRAGSKGASVDGPFKIRRPGDPGDQTTAPEQHTPPPAQSMPLTAGGENDAPQTPDETNAAATDSTPSPEAMDPAAPEAQSPSESQQPGLPRIEPPAGRAPKIRLKPNIKLAKPPPLATTSPTGESPLPGNPADSASTVPPGSDSESDTPEQSADTTDTTPTSATGAAAPARSEREAKATHSDDATAQPAPATPPPAAESKRPKVKSAGTKLPDNLRQPPAAATDGKRARGNRHAHAASQRGWAAPLGCVLLLTAGNVLTIKPYLETWLFNGTVPTAQLVAACIATLLMACLILSRILVLRLLACLVLLVMIAYCIGAIVVPFAWQSLPSSIHAFAMAVQMPDTSNVGVHAGTAALFVGSLFLLFGRHAVLWAFAALCFAGGIAAAFLPVDSLLPTPAGAPRTVEMDSLRLSLPSGWMLLEEAEGFQKLATLDGAVVLTVERHTPEAVLNLDDFAAEMMDLYRTRHPSTAQFGTSVPGRPNQKRLFQIGETRMEVLLVQRDNGFYSIAFEGTEEVLKNRQDMVRSILAGF